MNYAKLAEDGNLSFAPNPLITEDMQHFNPTEHLLVAQGYKKVEYSEPDPPQGYVATSVWTETDDAIVQSWIYQEIEFEEEEPPDD